MLSAILKLETLDECRAFFDALCTVPELRAMSQRVAVAHMLKEGWVYTDIVSKTGASTATISRVKRSFPRDDSEPSGYEPAFARLTDEELSMLPRKLDQ